MTLFELWGLGMFSFMMICVIGEFISGYGHRGP